MLYNAYCQYILYTAYLDDLLMAQAHLPMPRLPDEVTRSMVDQLKTLPA
jgi:hypothetical protein